MTGRSRRFGAALVVAAFAALATPLAASAAEASAAKLVRKGIARALGIGWIKSADAVQYRADVGRALYDIRVLPPLRGAVLRAQLAQVSAIWDSYISPRALALFSQLEENLAYLESNRIPSGSVDVTGPDGVVYRWFPGQGLEFHPLANFSALDNFAAAKDEVDTQLLAESLVARGIPRNGSLLWEYAFPWEGARPPWASGFAQAMAAQSLARASTLLADPSLMVAAGRAYRAIPGKLDVELAAGPWIRLYGFNYEIVLNAQLQSVLSLEEYGAAAADAGAQALAQQMLAAVRALFPRFDTGDWSLYELGGGYAPLEYQQFVTTLLGKLAKQTGDPFWQDAAARFLNYTYQPPQVTQTPPAAPLVAYPQPLDGWLDTVQIPVVLSKRASLTLAVAGKVVTWRRLPRGANVLTWKPGTGVKPGTYPVTVRAVDFLGNHAAYKLAPVTIAWDTAPPPLSAQVDTSTNTLTWSATDPGTPWLELTLELTDPSGAQAPQTVALGQEPTSGTLQLSIPPGSWNATLSGTNSAGLTTTVTLPELTGAAPPSQP